MRVELTGFAPDLDPATPGVVTDCDAIVPTAFGLSAANSAVDANYPTLATAPASAYVAELLDGSKRTLVASTTKIYEAAGGVWADRSRAGDYTGTNRTRFCVFGNAVLSTNRTQIIGAASPGGGFADITNAPAALVLVQAAGFVMALNINGMGLGDTPDGWGCSGIRDHTVWVPSTATQCAAGRLLDSTGAIKAGAALGSDVVAYKNSSMYLGRYVGGAIVWAWQRIPGDIGCSGPESVVVVGTRHFFVGPTDFYVFDGTVPTPIGGQVREWFFAQLNQTHRDKIYGVVDLARKLIYWYYPSTASSDGSLDSVLVYNYARDKWGKQAISIQAAVQYAATQVTYDGLGSMFNTYDDLPEVAYDSPFWLSDATIPGILTGNKLYSLTGTPGSSFLTSGDFGDLTEYSMLLRSTPRYRVAPTSAQGTNYYRASLDELPTQDSTIAMTSKRFDFRRASRWHRLRIDQVGHATINGLDVVAEAAGGE